MMCQGQAVWRQTQSVDRPIPKWQRAKLADQEFSQLPGAAGGSQVEAPAVGGVHSQWAGVGDAWL